MYRRTSHTLSKSMTRPTVLLPVALAGLLTIGSASAQTAATPARITPEQIDAHLRFLSSDLLEGRAPATRGGRLAEEYIASQLRAFGVLPGVGDTSYFQRVPIDVVKADPKTVKVTASGKANANLRFPDEVVVGSNSVEHRLLPRAADAPPPIGVRGWITDNAATALLAQAGLSMATLRKQAESRDFRPVSTGIVIDATMQNSMQHMAANNVIGVVRGIDPRLRDEYVAYSAHWDHFGIGPVVNGDSIYNGSVDN